MIAANIALVHRERHDLIVRAYNLSPVSSNGGGWWPSRVLEPFTGAWQRNIEWTTQTVLAHPTVYACVTLIASDIAKMDTMLVQEIKPGLWLPTFRTAFSPVLREPNGYQTEAQFKQSWIISKLLNGNTYIYQVRDDRDVVVEQHVLDPSRVKVLVAPDGSVFYELQPDNLGALPELVTVPGSEIVHDRINCFFHPLVGVSPLYAAGGPATVGLTIQTNSSNFFLNDSSPPGILTTPNTMTQTQADEALARWHSRVKGKIAVLGNGLNYQPLRMSVVEAQTIEHLNWTDEAICRAFKVPPFMVGVGPLSTLANAEVDTRKYLTTCLQAYVHDFEKCMDRGLGLMRNKEGKRLGIELDKRALLQMDTATQYHTLAEGVRGGFMAPNEARLAIDLPPLKGGDTVYLQHQDYSIEALFERDQNDPFAKPDPAVAAVPALPPGQPEADDEEEEDDAEAERSFARHVSLRTRTLRLRMVA